MDDRRATSCSITSHPLSCFALLLRITAFALPALSIFHARAYGQTERPVIDRDLLSGVEDRAPVRDADQNYYEAQAYNYVVVRANKTPVELLARNARRDVTFAHLYEEPEKYRGEIIHIEGRLRRLRRFDASRAAAKEGVSHLYEGWVFGAEYFSNPYCIILTEIPASMQIGEKLEYRVAFDGYFFKRYRYKAGDGWRDAPLLIGHALSEQKAPPPEKESPWSLANLMLVGSLSVIGTTILLVAGLAWWFRRGDQRIRARLDTVRTAKFVEPDEHETPH
jgi:hypothetical protein